jgi:hypothetical protein
LKTANPFKSLQITPPYGGLLLGAVLLLILIFLAGEGIIRLGMSLNLWPAPLLGTANAELDIKVQALDAIAVDENIDCIFLGSSQLDTAINPGVFSETYLQETGETLKCYNFSLGTLTAGPAGKIATLLVYRYHPKLLVIGISARDFSRDFGELARPLTADPWVKDHLAQPNLTGRLTEGSLFFRFLNQTRVAFNPDYQVFRDRLLRQLAPDGFLQYTGNDLTIDTAEFIPKYKLNAEDLSGLDEAMAMKDQGVKVILLEVPVYPDFLPHYVEGDTEKYFTAFRVPIQKRVDVYGVPFVYSQEEIGTYIPGSGWNDVKHLNTRGAEIYSRWFARKAAELYKPALAEIPISMANHGNH